MRSLVRLGLLPGWILVVLVPGAIHSADQPQWGSRDSRNMVSEEVGLPDGFDPKTDRNVKWSVPLGTECYSTPVVAQGRVLVGTNNNEPRDERHVGDRGVMMCFREADGKLLWQLVVPKLEGDIFLDWPNAGICSPATVEGDRVYAVTNRDEAVCLDLQGMANGNDGPYRDEGRHMAPREQAAMDAGPLDADILWLFDLRSGAGVRPHDSSHCSILLDGPFLYVNTSNGLTNRHDGVDKPDAPSLIVLEKATGRYVARDGQPIGPRIFHSTWSSPALGEVGGRRLVFFCGGDGVCYAFEALKWNDDAGRGSPDSAGRGSPDPAQTTDRRSPSTDKEPPLAAPSTPGQPSPSVKSLHLVWRFDCDPTAPKENVHRYIRNRKVSPSNIKSMPVFDKGRLYVTVGGDIWWGKHQAWLKCIDATKTGDITATGQVWSYAVGRHCCSTPSVHEGLVYVADCDGKVHCVDADTGRPYWVHDAGGEIWASTLVADGKVYIGTRRGQFWVLAAGKEKRVLSSIRLDAPIHSSTVAANGTLYVATMKRLYAIRKEGS